MANQAPDIAQDAVLVHSGPLPVDPVEICGYDFNNGIDFSGLLKSFYTTGFQATNFAQAVDEINRMVSPTVVVKVLWYN
jgi:deoxyhypusine synthase